MGGDHAPEAVIAGAVAALERSDSDLRLVLVGDESRLAPLLSGRRTERLSIQHAPEVIAMEEAALAALRRKRRSSIQVGLELQAAGEVDAFVSAGHTGAVMAAAMTTLGRVEGIARPAIAAIFPTQSFPCIVLDAGANVDPRPQHMLQFAIMGHVYARDVLGRERPRVGLLSIGEEPTKGNELTIAVHELLRRSSLNFIGNIEGRGVLRGAADVVVTDGFTGNVVLKFGESFVDFLADAVGEEVRSRALARLGALLMRSTFRSLRRRIDYAEYGGAPLLGVDGVVIIAHGESNAKAFSSAIEVARRAIDRELDRRIGWEIAGLPGEGTAVDRTANQVIGGGK